MSYVYNYTKRDSISKNDIHILLFLKNKLTGYVLLRKKKYILKKKKCNYLHFDTLIVKKNLRNKKLSTFLMDYVNNIISIEKKISLLYCNKNMFKFYKKYKWKIVRKNKYRLDSPDNKKLLLVHY